MKFLVESGGGMKNEFHHSRGQGLRGRKKKSIVSHGGRREVSPLRMKSNRDSGSRQK